jgi:hypothetical protein
MSSLDTQKRSVIEIVKEIGTLDCSWKVIHWLYQNVKYEKCHRGKKVKKTLLTLFWQLLHGRIKDA